MATTPQPVRNRPLTTGRVLAGLALLAFVIGLLVVVFHTDQGNLDAVVKDPTTWVLAGLALLAARAVWP